ncbi:hypothetical protein K402DRAFT_454666 [Aulographum hederae CBS 113979]|uniref:NACHT domain-containing protein n=1 Tax=Aulographum hederae CBS 113979 TaxID=1176131 RepID=A0A6G1GYE5_9PEZI|nr:hypothetical protein K402DRAFT_454666 [Aulographum hederae CBS 113979]
MDPLSALGLAANVVQFVEFGAKIVSRSHTLYKSGQLVDWRDLQATANELALLFKTLKRSTTTISSVPQFKPEEQALYRLAEECADVAHELNEVTEGLKVDTEKSRRVWRSIRHALQSVYKDEKLEQLNKRLNGFRDQLNTHILVSLKCNIDLISIQQSARFDLQGEATRRIIQILLDERDNFTAKLQSQIDVITHLAETLDATITADGDRTRSQLHDTIENLQLRDVEQSYESFSRPWTIEAERVQRVHFENHVLEKLYDGLTKERQEDIAQAHKRTFEWIYSNSAIQENAQLNFSKWLSEDTNLYWVSGKAGSGKSTLMKYIDENPKTRELLTTWAHNRPLAIASFYVWNAGSHVQKSEEGLLRSLLYQTLVQCAALICTAFPDDWAMACENYRRGRMASATFKWKVKTYRQAILNLVRQTKMKVAFCFFVDGLDECTGRHDEVAELFQCVSRYENAKVCVSSRPLLDFEDSFRGFPTLMLEHLTHDDIKFYTSMRLRTNFRFTQLLMQEPMQAEILEESVVSRASGVFLWVKLVVGSLIEGIRNYDRITDLQKRLDLLPSDLEELYFHMFTTVQPLYLEHAAKLFRIVSTLDSGELSPLQLAFADEEDEELVFTIPCETMKEEEKVRKCREIEGRLKSRCRGLLEVQGLGQNALVCHEYVDAWKHAKVEWLHRTVPDYIRSPRIASILASAVSETFNPDVALLRSRILELKVDLHPQTPARFRSLVSEALSCAARAELILQVPQNDLCLELLKIIPQQWAHVTSRTTGWQNCILDDWDLPADNEDAFYSLCAVYNIGLFLKEKLDHDPGLIRRHRKARSLLRLVVLPTPKTHDSWWRDLNIIEMVLQKGADPNKIDDEASPWQHLLDFLHQDFRKYLNYASWSLRGENQRTATQWCKIATLFVDYGADPDATYTCTGRRTPESGKSFTATEVVRETFSKWIPSSGQRLEKLLQHKAQHTRRRTGPWKRSFVGLSHLSPPADAFRDSSPEIEGMAQRSVSLGAQDFGSPTASSNHASSVYLMSPSSATSSVSRFPSPSSPLEVHQQGLESPKPSFRVRKRRRRISFSLSHLFRSRSTSATASLSSASALVVSSSSVPVLPFSFSFSSSNPVLPSTSAPALPSISVPTRHSVHPPVLPPLSFTYESSSAPALPSISVPTRHPVHPPVLPPLSFTYESSSAPALPSISVPTRHPVHPPVLPPLSFTYASSSAG